MKVLYYHPTPYSILPPGGAQAQLDQTRLALVQLGVEVDFLRWWDAGQQGDIIHHFGRPRVDFVEFARQRGFRVVVTDLLGGTGARPRWQLAAYKLIGRAARQVGAVPVLDRFAWCGVNGRADAVLASTEWEAKLMREIFGLPAAKVHVLTNSVDDAYLNSVPCERGPWLVTSGWIGAVKRTLEMAEAALLAGTPLWVIGRPRIEGDSYSQRFIDLARQHPQVIRYEGFVPKERLVQAYREARGFVLLSKFETLSLSALEATACECPLLLTGLPWAQTTFGDKASYCRPAASVSVIAGVLRKFYDAAPNLPRAPRPMTWLEVAGQLKGIYESLLRPNTSR